MRIFHASRRYPINLGFFFNNLRMDDEEDFLGITLTGRYVPVLPVGRSCRTGGALRFSLPPSRHTLHSADAIGI
jgi:hypothetical protein